MNKRYTGLTALRTAVLALAFLVGGQSAWATDEADLIEGEGVVRSVSISTAEVEISGFVYTVLPQASVQIRGTASSIAALGEGMKVRFVYEVIEGFDAMIAAMESSNLIHELEQLPDSQVLEEF